MRIVVAGFGKIGRIKASIWRDIGGEVVIYDPNPPAQEDALKEGYSLLPADAYLQDMILDISSPSGSHFSALNYFLENFPGQTPKLCIIEKPLGSSRAELLAFESLPQKIQDIIVVNETYFVSTVIKQVKHLINPDLPWQLDVELSKNRLPDRARGRFFDHYLGAWGIEAPHMLAIVQELGVDLTKLTTLSAITYTKHDCSENQGMVCELSDGANRFRLCSFLGDFSLRNNEIINDNYTKRVVTISQGLQTFLVQFDPADGIDRYHSSLSLFEEGDLQSTNILADNHLRNFLQICLKDPQAIPRTNNLENSLAIAKFLIDLKDRSKTIDVSVKMTRKVGLAKTS